MVTIRMFLAVANQRRMKVVQFDIKTAFLYGELEEELFMEQPENYITDPNKVCKLNKSLYGLKQAPRMWNRKFDEFLKRFDLLQGSTDKCLYYNRERTLLLTIYVDDGLAAGCDQKQLDNLIKYLRSNFELKILSGESFLGFRLVRDSDEGSLGIVQNHYVLKLLERFNMSECKPVPTPEQVGADLNNSPLLPITNQFKELVGCLLYLSTCSRPDISHAISVASRTSSPTEAHWSALKRILRYLRGTIDLGIKWKQVKNSLLLGYSDADYANDTETRKSTTGLCIMLNGGPIMWKSQRQAIITLSTTESEYVAGCELVKDLLPIREQLSELGEIDSDKPTAILIDNQSAVRISNNESGLQRTKHIDIRRRWLNEQVQAKKIIVNHISSDKQAADILTKALYRSKFETNRSFLMTQLTLLCMIGLCSAEQGQLSKTTDHITLVPSGNVYIYGDNRYKLSNTFVNPCEVLFNYSTTLSITEVLIKHCNEYYEQKLLQQLTNCRRL